MRKFDKIYKHIMLQQKNLNIVTQWNWKGTLKEIFVNPLVGAADTVKGLATGDFKKVGKAILKTLSAPIGAFVQLGKPSCEQLQEQFEASKKVDWKKDPIAKKAFESTRKFKDKELKDQFTNWSQGGKEFVEKHKELLPIDYRRTLAYRNYLKAAQKNKDTVEQLAKGSSEEEESSGDDKYKEYKEILLYVCKDNEKKKLGLLFDKKVKEDKKILYIHPKNGKLMSWKTDQLNDKKLNILKKTKDKAKEARASR